MGGKGGRVPPLTENISKNMEKITKIRLKIGEIGQNWDLKMKKLGKKGKNQEGSFTLPLMTGRADYATADTHGSPNLFHLDGEEQGR